jgi:hypothetical protein
MHGPSSHNPQQLESGRAGYPPMRQQLTELQLDETTCCCRPWPEQYGLDNGFTIVRILRSRPVQSKQRLPPLRRPVTHEHLHSMYSVYVCSDPLTSPHSAASCFSPPDSTATLLRHDDGHHQLNRPRHQTAAWVQCIVPQIVGRTRAAHVGLNFVALSSF